MAAVSLTGDWLRAHGALAGGGASIKRAITKALAYEANQLRKEIVLGIRNQAPGGDAFRPLSRLTKAGRRMQGFRGSKALQRSGDLVNSVTVITSEDTAFVGVPRSAKQKRSKRTSPELVRVAEIHEFGTTPAVIPITPKMQRFLGALFAKATRARKRKNRRAKSPQGLVVVQIPARPFLRPAFEKWRKGVDRRLYKRVAQEMGWMDK